MKLIKLTAIFTKKLYSTMLEKKMHKWNKLANFCYSNQQKMEAEYEDWMNV